jgi:integrase
MKGYITSRKGSYRLTISLGKDSATGKYRQYRETVKGTRTIAEKRLRELLTQLDKGIFTQPGKVTLAEYLELWLRDYCCNLSPRTAEGYATIIHKHLIPALGKIPLTQLRPDMIQAYYSKQLSGGRCDGSGGLNALTVKHHHVCLHTALQNAVKTNLLPRNPCDAVTAPRSTNKEMCTMNESDIHIFLEFAKAPKYSEYYALFYTALFTGMRRSELLALRWQDCDLLLMQISVSRSLHALSNGRIVFRPCKTEKSRRLISLSPSSVSVLEEHREALQKLRDSLGLAPLSDSDLIFSHFDGKPLLPNTVSHVWEKLAKRTGLKGIHFHSARHSMASIMLKIGIHPKIVQERLGHSSIQITLDTYSHVAPGLQEAAAKRFDDIILPKHLDTVKK